MSPGTLQMSAEVDITPTKAEITSGATLPGISGIAASNDPAPNPKVIGKGGNDRRTIARALRYVPADGKTTNGDKA
jgi:hypothetical protein